MVKIFISCCLSVYFFCALYAPACLQQAWTIFKSEAFGRESWAAHLRRAAAEGVCITCPSKSSSSAAETSADIGLLGSLLGSIAIGSARLLGILLGLIS